MNREARERGYDSFIRGHEFYALWVHQGGIAIDGKWLMKEPDCNICKGERDKLVTFRAWGFFVDHAEELVDGGLSVIENLQLLCWPCCRDKTYGEKKERGRLYYSPQLSFWIEM